MTINGARGFNAKIADRFDLTLECIRQHYLNGSSPLEETLNRYSDFFQLFGSFRGYVNYFFLEDLVSANYDLINYFTSTPIDLEKSPIPQTKATYLQYMENSIQFLINRNTRINSYAVSLSDTLYGTYKLADHVCSFCNNKDSLAIIYNGEIKYDQARNELYLIEPIAYSDTRDQANIICIKCGSKKFGYPQWVNY